ncbi:MAG: helix-turn-helix transcriptional regulator [Acidobacteria bacterium]|nr:helix-turn-helix transcriptional regulator [Acidobacteriota bacterium]
MDYIEAHLHENLHLEEIADVLQMSPYHFGRLFKQSTGLTPHQYLVRQRIMKAKELLAEDGSSIAEIGRLLGFASHAHFTTVFRKLTGITPREYRAQNAK